MNLLYHKLTVIALALTLGIGAAPSPVRADAPPLSAKDKKQAAEESKEGREAAEQVAKSLKLLPDAEINARVNAIGQKIAAVANTTVVPANYGNDHVYPFTWHFAVVDSKDVNAFSLPGGYVYVNKGLIDFVKSDDELAGVLAHEITHAAHHHISALSHEQSKMSTQMALGVLAAILAHVPAQDIGNLTQGAQYLQMGVLNTRYSQAAERDADHGGTILMQKAGYNPLGMMTFMQRLAGIEKRSVDLDLGILRDHPYTEQRVSLIKDQLTQMKVPITTLGVARVSGAPRASVKAVGDESAALLYGDKTVVTLADPDGVRCAAAAKILNSLLDDGLQMYQIRAENGVLLAADRPLFTLTPADMTLRAGATPVGIAEDAARVLRAGLWAQTVNGSSVP